MEAGECPMINGPETCRQLAEVYRQMADYLDADFENKLADSY
jgi:hypothetical protein